jgi:16S rRNA processing protein RimM
MQPAGRSNRGKKRTGSSDHDEPVFLVIGRIRRPFGLKDEWLFQVMSDFPERLVPGKLVYLGQKKQSLHIRTIKDTHKDYIVSFAPVIPHTAPVQNQLLYITADDLPPLAAGLFYHHQVIGIDVSDENGSLVGTLVEILGTGANDVYVIKKLDGNELLLPAIDSVIKHIDPEKKKMVVKIPEWI